MTHGSERHCILSGLGRGAARSPLVVWARGAHVPSRLQACRLGKAAGRGCGLSPPRAFAPLGVPRGHPSLTSGPAFEGLGCGGSKSETRALHPSSRRRHRNLPLGRTAWVSLWFAANRAALGPSSASGSLQKVGLAAHPSEGRCVPGPLSGCRESPWLRWEGRGCGRGWVGWHQAQHSGGASSLRRPLPPRVSVHVAPCVRHGPTWASRRG